MKYKLIAVAVFAALFPYCLNRTEALGYDFPIYYSAGAGSISSDYAQGAFVYSHRIVPVFRPLAKLPYWAAFGIFYAATAAAIYSLLRRISRHFDSYPVLVSALWIVVGGAGFIILRCGNVTGILALLEANLIYLASAFLIGAANDTRRL